MDEKRREHHDRSSRPLLPSSSPSSIATAPLHPRHQRSKLTVRRSRALKLVALACLVFIAFSQWKQTWQLPSLSHHHQNQHDKSSATSRSSHGPFLSLEKLQEDIATCKKLRNKPKDPIGLGRDKNARYLGGRPTLIKNATICIGEPVQGTSESDARAGKGWGWVRGDIFIDKGLIQKVDVKSSSSSSSSLSTTRDHPVLPEDTLVYDAKGRQLTSGIIDMHSHAGVNSLPELFGYQDTNEFSDNITPWARSIDGVFPLDHQFSSIKSGGVTTTLILPGSANNMGGEAFLFKLAVGKSSGREEISAVDMLADPERNWRFMKMACGENAKRVYGRRGLRPASRMGESFAFRHAFEQAADLLQRQDDWCARAEEISALKEEGEGEEVRGKRLVRSMESYLPQELKWESLGAALRGQVHINTHCYTVPDLEAMVDHSNEFKFAIRAFHHAHQTFLVPEILNRTWGGRPPSSALFADNMYYKVESYVASEFAGKYLHDAGLTVVYVSDHPVTNSQHVLFEAAKGYRYGLPYHAALASVTTAPAEELGMGKRLGKIKPGFDADIVVWDSDPLSVGATPVQVWIDGVAQFEEPVELDKPASEPMTPDSSLGTIIEEPTEMKGAVVFSGITNLDSATVQALVQRHGYNFDDKITRDGSNGHDQIENKFEKVIIEDGKIVCLGHCSLEASRAAASGARHVTLRNGYLSPSFVAAGSGLGLGEIDLESATQNGGSGDVFSRGVDGLLLGGKKLRAAGHYGVTRAISAPWLNVMGTHWGISVGFNTGANTAAEAGAVFATDYAVHYTLKQEAVRGQGVSYSTAVGGLRQKLIRAATTTTPASNAWTELAFVKKVLLGEMVLAVTVQSADGIAALLRVKSDVEGLLTTMTTATTTTTKRKQQNKIKMAIIGGTEAYMVAEQLRDADVGVIVDTPHSTYPTSWDRRRALPGAPLSNGTNIDRLLDAGVLVGIGLDRDWEVRALGLAAGIAYRNSEGRLSEKQALDLVSSNVLEILGVDEEDEEGSGKKRRQGQQGHFLISEGSPLDIGSRIKAVSSGGESLSVFI